MTSDELLRALRPLLEAECAAEAPGAGVEAADLAQAVRLRWLERARREDPPAAPAAWLRAAVRAEARTGRRRLRRELPLPAVPAPSAPAAGHPGRVTAVDGLGDWAWPTEALVLASERRRALVAAIARLPGRCPAVLRALISRSDPTYPEIAAELGISQGSLGPVRSRCLGCLRRMLSAEVAAPELRGMVR